MHEFTIEILYHMNCSDCKNWWSHAVTPKKTDEIGMPLDWGMTGKYVYCPHCGLENELKLKENYEYL